MVFSRVCFKVHTLFKLDNPAPDYTSDTPTQDMYLQYPDCRPIIESHIYTKYAATAASATSVSVNNQTYIDCARCVAARRAAVCV